VIFIVVLTAIGAAGVSERPGQERRAGTMGQY
jgi:hypothetical protein